MFAQYKPDDRQRWVRSGSIVLHALLLAWALRLVVVCRRLVVLVPNGGLSLSDRCLGLLLRGAGLRRDRSDVVVLL